MISLHNNGSNELSSYMIMYDMVYWACKFWYDDTNKMNALMNMKYFLKDDLWFENTINGLKKC